MNDAAREAFEGRRCVVTGANGFVGSHLVRRLVEAGAETRALVRATSDVALLEGAGAERVFGDITDRPSLEAAFDGADYVFHVAGIVKALEDSRYFTINDEACGEVCAAVLSAAPALRRMVFVSSIAAAGPTVPGRPLRESDPANPVSLYGRSKLAGEERMAGYRDRIPITTIRPPMVFGPGDSATYDLFRALSRHLKAVVTGGPRVYSSVYVTDLADGMMAAAAADAAVGETFYIASPEVISYADFQDEILQALDTWALRIPVPALIMPLVGRVAEVVSRRRGRASVLSRQKVAEALPAAWLCSPDKAQELLGFETAVRIPEGLRRQADWYREQGWL